MRKAIFLLAAALLLVAFLRFSFAQEAVQEKEHMMKDMHEKMGKEGKTPMHGMMIHKMMPKEMVTTPDGGVIVLVGNKLLKYDKDLNLVKEVEINIDMEAMMKKMKECRAMMKKHNIEEETE